MSREPRRWADLRGGRPVQPQDPNTIEDAIRRLFSTQDGRRVLDHMIEETHAPCYPGAEDRALREREGARRFVANLRETASSARAPGKHAEPDAG